MARNTFLIICVSIIKDDMFVTKIPELQMLYISLPESDSNQFLSRCCADMKHMNAYLIDNNVLGYICTKIRFKLLNIQLSKMVCS